MDQNHYLNIRSFSNIVHYNTKVVRAYLHDINRAKDTNSWKFKGPLDFFARYCYFVGIGRQSLLQEYDEYYQTLPDIFGVEFLNHLCADDARVIAQRQQIAAGVGGKYSYAYHNTTQLSDFSHGAGSGELNPVSRMVNYLSSLASGYLFNIRRASPGSLDLQDKVWDEYNDVRKNALSYIGLERLVSKRTKKADQMLKRLEYAKTMAALETSLIDRVQLWTRNQGGPTPSSRKFTASVKTPDAFVALAVANTMRSQGYPTLCVQDTLLLNDWWVSVIIGTM